MNAIYRLLGIMSTLRDLLFQVVFYAQMTGEQDCFTLDLPRHQRQAGAPPSAYFWRCTASTSSEVLKNWEAIKTAERVDKAQHSALDDIPKALPALMRAHKIQKRCHMSVSTGPRSGAGGGESARRDR